MGARSSLPVEQDHLVVSSPSGRQAISSCIPPPHRPPGHVRHSEASPAQALQASATPRRLAPRLARSLEQSRVQPHRNSAENSHVAINFSPCVARRATVVAPHADPAPC